MAEPNKTKTQEEKKEKSILKRIGIFPYLRELSVVIIGVLVTLMITNMVSNLNRQKEIRSMMKFVREELFLNLKNLEWSQYRWEGEQHIFQLLKVHADDISRIPVDTLRKYEFASGALHSLDPISDSYDLLKTSLLVQYVKEKDILRELSKTYGRFRSLDDQLSTYSSQKTRVFLHPMIDKMSPEESALWQDGNLYDFFRILMEDDGFRKFVHTGSTILSPTTIFEDNKENIRKTIEMMEKYGYYDPLLKKAVQKTLINDSLRLDL